MENHSYHREVNIFLSARKEETERAADKASDLELWSAFRQGDEAAFVDIYKTYVNKLYNYGTKFCSDRELVKDCLQDFFIYLRKNRETLGDTTSIKFYLFKAFRRRVVDYIKAQETEQKKNQLADIFQLQIEVSDEVKFIDRQLHEQQLLRLNNAIAALTEKEREAIFYYFYEGLSYQDIAKILNFTHIASARRLIYRSLSNIKDMLIILSCLVAPGLLAFLR
ncbi:RNA polymerase sigma factor [Parachryseolinea silvisoli]|uniref:RNA polymerase sigma factor n=1 Tax=Parachryseolinea silvisoli TaxID=2873601 RepID=UPI002265AA97|nr:sigma-70 family RNA polymerase sigma factor [Parachryseolinea silvisoli]MCD9018798.1 sigma-70 family RNA polymerase sigma factor [Parachryseolinea silvisoli]